MTNMRIFTTRNKKRLPTIPKKTCYTNVIIKHLSNKISLDDEICGFIPARFLARNVSQNLIIKKEDYKSLNFCNNFVITFMNIMEISVIKIGNSKGLRLSKDILTRYNIKDTVELVLEKGYIILKPTSTPRKGWEEAFKEMHERQDDHLLMDDVFEDENFEEWT